MSRVLMRGAWTVRASRDHSLCDPPRLTPSLSVRAAACGCASWPYHSLSAAPAPSPASLFADQTCYAKPTLGNSKPGGGTPGSLAKKCNGGLGTWLMGPGEVTGVTKPMTDDEHKTKLLDAALKACSATDTLAPPSSPARSCMKHSTCGTCLGDISNDYRCAWCAQEKDLCAPLPLPMHMRDTCASTAPCRFWCHRCEQLGCYPVREKLNSKPDTITAREQATDLHCILSFGTPLRLGTPVLSFFPAPLLHSIGDVCGHALVCMRPQG